MTLPTTSAAVPARFASWWRDALRFPALRSYGVLLVALTLAALALHVPGDITVGPPPRKDVFVAIVAVSVAVYFAAVRHVLRRPVPGLATVLLVALVVRVPVLVAPPFLSTDVNRYVWDGRVQAAGINPYLYLPAAPELAFLRDAKIYPDISRATYARTIYQPAAQMVFAAVGRIAPSILGMKAAMVGFEALAVVCLIRLLALAGLPATRVLIYAWNPLAVWAFAGNGHVDAVAIGLLCVALLLSCRGRDGLAGVALAAAVATKFLPAVIAPALWRARTGWRTALCGLLTLGALYACYAGAGWHVFGFLAGYGGEEGIDDGSGLWLLAGLKRLDVLPPGAASVYLAAVAIGLVWLGAHIAFRQRPRDPVETCGAAALLAALTTVAISPHYPWYFVWLAAPAVLRPSRAVVFLSAAPVLLYLNPFGDQFVWPSVVYVPAAVLAALDLRRSPAPVSAAPAPEGRI